VTDQQTEVRVRRAPKFGAFMGVGAALGLIGTFIATIQFPADPSVGFGPLFAYFSLFGVSAGVVLGALLALMFDRRSRKRAKLVAAERETVAAGPEA